MVEQCLVNEKRLNDEDIDYEVDMFKLRVFVLCLSRGTSDFKAQRLFDLIIGKHYQITKPIN